MSLTCRVAILHLLFSIGLSSCVSQNTRLVKEGIRKIDRGRYYQAIFIFNKVLEDDSVHEKALYYRGLSYCALKEYKNALADFTKVLEENKTAVGALINRGIIYALVGKEKESLEDFTQALVYDPDNPKIYSNRGGLYARKKDYSRALTDFNRALKGNPESKKLLAYRGDMLSGLGRYREAIMDYDHAIGHDSKDGDLYRRRANTLWIMGEEERAIEDLRKSTSLQPRNALSYAVLGMIHFDRKDYARALANFAMAQGFGRDKIVDELPLAFFYMGEAYRRLDFSENALDSYETFLSLNPDHELKRSAEKALETLKKN